jgi:hypothetical protein
MSLSQEDERIRTISVSCPVHPALDEIIQELEVKLDLKPGHGESGWMVLFFEKGSRRVGASIVPNFTFSELPIKVKKTNLKFNIPFLSSVRC